MAMTNQVDDCGGGAPDGRRFYGKYRGLVTKNNDEMFLGRIKATVPDVLGSKESGWAMPCMPFGGDGMGMFCLPKVGAGVWIEFEHGNPDYPIYTGSWWGAISQVPSDVYGPVPWKKLMMKTEGGSVFIMDDTPVTGGITLKTSGGQLIKLTQQGIEITFGPGRTIKLAADGLKVFDTALEVT